MPAACSNWKSTLAPGEETEIVLLLGQGCDAADAGSWSQKYRSADLDTVLADVAAFWDEPWAPSRFNTPDTADGPDGQPLAAVSDAVLPHLGPRGILPGVAALMVSAISCRTAWRCAVSSPDLAREQILRAAGRQFEEGDVQHWWLPESGKGIRTRISDDKAWLAYVTAHYVEATGDIASWTSNCRSWRRRR